MNCIWGDAYHEEDRPNYDEYVRELINGEDYDAEKEEWYDSQKILPEARVYTGELEDTVSPITLRGGTNQCVIKYADIHLTPESSLHAGGSWHIEGMANRHIVASGIYYHYDDYVQEIGQMHCVSPFELLDRSNLLGHCKILAIFLGDPTIDCPIPSATNVPPQQVEWACDELQELFENEQRSLVSRLPQELVDPIKEQEAEAYGLKLMEERTVFGEKHSDIAYGVQFNSCEHY
ncbi:hypothetical protein MVEN_02510200 [Mycena venus]|uniref:DUF4246 domain-containing protein n=1 Tax=Mycena venus TaxID=2733690 RepID=A0A8H6U0C3_9AGAR|nr:hypothetical protein MVEN_02510200 [Mycena venus]